MIIYLQNSKTNHIFIKQPERSQKKSRIYYKDDENGLLASGITYRVTVEGGLAADAITQVMAKHYVPENSMIMFVDFVSPEAE